MDYLPQCVGRRCACCDKVISSIGEGAFCDHCFNPIHNECRPAADRDIADGHCLNCGADPNSAAAQTVRAEVEEEQAKGYKRLLCPNCGSTRGFRPFVEADAAANNEPALRLAFMVWPTSFALASLPFAILLGMGSAAASGQYECFRCGYVFQQRRTVSKLGCLVVVLLLALLILAVALVVTFTE